MNRLQTRHEVRQKAAGWINSTLDFWLPRHCLLCGLPSGQANLCQPCHEDLPRCGPACEVCALPLEEGGVCGQCLNRSPAWDRAVAALAYRFPADYLVCHFKFSRSLVCGDLLAQELIAAIEKSEAPRPQAIMPVPLHSTRLLRRSFNQAELLADSVGKAFDLPVLRSAMRRRRKTRAQSGLDAAARQKNLRGAIEVTRKIKDIQKVRHVALLDDVCTTGVTLAACCAALRRAGVEQVTVWVACRAPPPG